MSWANVTIGGFFVVVVLNTVVVRLSIGRTQPAVFWGVNALNVAAGVGALLFGVPGFEGSTLVRVLVGLAVLMHLAQNFAMKSRWDSEDRLDRLDEEMRERRVYEEARSEGSPAGSDGPPGTDPG